MKTILTQTKDAVVTSFSGERFGPGEYFHDTHGILFKWLFLVYNFPLCCLAFLFSRRNMFLISFAWTFVNAGYSIFWLNRTPWLEQHAKFSIRYFRNAKKSGASLVSQWVCGIVTGDNTTSSLVMVPQVIVPQVIVRWDLPQVSSRF